MDLLATLILAFAVARITALIVIDDIFEPARHRIFLLSPPETDVEGDTSLYTRLDRKGNVLKGATWREPGFVGKLLSCYMCTGIWVALAATAAYIHVPHAFTFFTVFALAQASDLIIKVARY